MNIQDKRTEGEKQAYMEGYNAGRKISSYKHKLEERFKKEIAYANVDIDLMPEQEEYMRGYLGGILCAYRIVFGKNYEESEEVSE